VVPVRVLLDSGSQKSYIKLKLNKLGLTALEKEHVSFSKQQCDLVNVKLSGENQILSSLFSKYLFPFE